MPQEMKKGSHNFKIPRLRFAYSLYNFRGAAMTIKSSLQMSIAIVKAFSADFWSNIWLGHVTCK